MGATLSLGNVAPLSAGKPAVDGEGQLIGNTVTDVEFPEGAQPEVVALLAENPKHSQRIRSLPGEQRDWYVHLLDVEDFWWASHSNDPPEWVEASDPDLAALIADYFTTDSHTSAVGRPADW